MKITHARSFGFYLAFALVLQACGSFFEPQQAEVVGLPVVQLPAVEPPVVEPPVVPANVVPVTLPEAVSGHAADQVSESGKDIAGGDRFTYGQFERPFNSESMDAYFPSLDIVDTVVHQDDSWLYGTIQLSALEGAEISAAKYALELDTDRDGKGDWLIVASNPASTDWTILGVQVYNDANEDVGNLSPMFTDEGASGDGFESVVFDQGTGTDPESAWVRVSPDNPNVIDIAVKRSVIGDPQSFMINMWAGHSLLDPALFDLNDAFTHEEAGAANPGFELFYPIKAVSEIDNSCRLAIGFQPSGGEPGLCKTLVHVNPSDPTSPYTPYTAPDLSCEPCNVGASGQEPYPDCTCTYPPIP